MSEVFTLQAEYQAMADELVISKDPIGAVHALSNEILPKYWAWPDRAVEAVPLGSGSCFAFTEVAATIANYIPGVDPMIAIQRHFVGGIRTWFHAECLVVETDSGVHPVNIRGYNETFSAAHTKDDNPYVLAGQSNPRDTLTYGVLDANPGDMSYGDWSNSQASTVEDVLRPLTPGHNIECLVMPVDIGIETLHAIGDAHNFIQTRRTKDLYGLYATHAALLDHYHMSPTGVLSGV